MSALIFRIPWVLILCLYNSLFIFSQSFIQSGQMEELQPYVRNIRTIANGNRVRVTWSDIQEIPIESYRVYRFTKEIFPEILPFAELLSTYQPGRESMEDLIDEDGSYYYAIRAVDNRGFEISILVSNQNKTTTAINIEGVSELFGIETIQSISATSLQRSINVSFRAPLNREFLLYRSTLPIQTIDDLNNSIRITRLNRGIQRYNDNVYPNISYYYAIIDSLIMELGIDTLSRDQHLRVLIPGVNATTQGVSVNEFVSDSNRNQFSNATNGEDINTRDLNTLSRIESIGESSIASTQVLDIQQETRDAVQRLILPDISQSELLLEPEIFDSEKKAMFEIAQDRRLAEIINSTLAQSNFSECESRVRSFLTDALSPDLEFRARFYYAQCLYFNEKPRSSIAQFSVIASTSPSIVNPWINNIFTNYLR